MLEYILKKYYYLGGDSILAFPQNNEADFLIQNAFTEFRGKTLRYSSYCQSEQNTNKVHVIVCRK